MLAAGEPIDCVVKELNPMGGGSKDRYVYNVNVRECDHLHTRKSESLEAQKIRGGGI